MAIYTRTGDTGETSLFDGDRVKKYDIRLKAYGELDNLNVALGKIKFLSKDLQTKRFIHYLQEDILTISSFLATKDLEKLPEKVKNFQFAEKIKVFEDLIDEITNGLPKLTAFLLPGSNELELACHEARVICRKAERFVVDLFEQEGGENRVLSYLNRLSDLLFSLARKFETEV